MNEVLDTMLLKLAEDALPGGGIAFERTVAERVQMRRLNTSSYRAGALAAAGAMALGVGGSLVPTVTAAHAQSFDPLSAMSMAPSTLLGGMR